MHRVSYTKVYRFESGTITYQDYRDHVHGLYKDDTLLAAVAIEVSEGDVLTGKVFGIASQEMKDIFKKAGEFFNFKEIYFGANKYLRERTFRMGGRNADK